MKETWQHLPADMRKTANNLATIRLGAVCFVLLIIVAFAQVIAHSTPEQFVRSVFSFGMVGGIVGVIAAILILVLRSMQVAPRFVTAYSEMLPDHADDISRIYAERGLADVIAPWVRGRQGVVSTLIRNLMRRFYIKP